MIIHTYEIFTYGFGHYSAWISQVKPNKFYATMYEAFNQFNIQPWFVNGEFNSLNSALSSIKNAIQENDADIKAVEPLLVKEIEHDEHQCR